MNNVKLCNGCHKIKNHDETEFYKAGSRSFQTHCKECHNKMRKKYKINSTKKEWIKKPTGFLKLSKEIQDKIIYDAYIKLSYAEIARKYNIPYITLINWKIQKQIPEYTI